ncbi:hypothetical protein [Kocuria flava]|uniref:hypothetical protein n=1 Tax=Kocuria flava TaxID=446860 RepID=UPI001FF3EB7A|nr:hypothetical protein [Kocuria flava]MCJ8503306.1 hypothetical protein [Kocuria flava]
MRYRRNLLSTAYFYFIGSVFALIIAFAFWLTGSDISLLLLGLGAVAVTGTLVIVAHRLTRKYKDE